jgi:hypothetical protein
MAMLPGLAMSGLLPDNRRPLPVLKVLYRNAQQIQSVGGASKTTLQALHAAEHAAVGDVGVSIRDACRKVDATRGEKLLASVGGSPLDLFNALQPAVQDDLNVHRFVFAHRTYGLVGLLGAEYSYSLLRQCVRLCADHERIRIEHKQAESPIRALLPKLLDQYKLLGKQPGKQKAEDAWVEKMAQTIYGGGRNQAAEAVAAALAEGMSPEDIGEAMSLAANRLVLCDPGRRKDQAQPGKPEGSVHGASVGVHASDSANAWRNISRVSDARNIYASLIVGAYHTAGQNGGQNKEPQPSLEQLEKIKSKDAAALLSDAEAAIKEKDQARAATLIHRYGELGHPARGAFDLLLKFAVSEDGALHAEKYYRTVSEEFAATRQAFRWRQLVALARVTASEYGFPAAGYSEACGLLKV